MYRAGGLTGPCEFLTRDQAKRSSKPSILKSQKEAQLVWYNL